MKELFFVALINCPECGKEISDKCVACINCGYPLNQSVETAFVPKINRDMLVIKKFNKAKARKGFDRCLFDFSLTEYPDLKEPNMKAGKNVAFKDREGNCIGMFCVDTCMYLGEICTIGFNELSDIVYESVSEIHTDIVQTHIKKPDVPNEVKCPTCGSSNVERVSSLEKAVNIGMFGLLGNKRKKQFRCNNCKYMW